MALQYSRLRSLVKESKNITIVFLMVMNCYEILRAEAQGTYGKQAMV
jgi:hypothetical protein